MSLVATLARARRRAFHPVTLPPAGTRERIELLAAGALLVLALAVLAIPPVWLSALGGNVRDAEHRPLIATAAFIVGSACLAASLWAAVRSFMGTRAERLGTVILSLIVMAQFGGVYRTVLQIAELHDFYLADPQCTLASAYWGLTVLLIATFAFALPFVLMVASLLPGAHGPAWYRATILAIRERRHFLMLPLLGSVAIVGICFLLPVSLRVSLGYSAPGLDGSRILYSLDVLNASIWQSFARLLFLPLLVGMWEGLESARACFTFVSRGALANHLGSRRRYPLLLAGTALACAIAVAVLAGAPLLLPAAVALTTIVALASGGAAPRLAGIPALRSGSQFGFSEEWQSAAPIARVLLVLAVPALVPLGIDLWHGLEGPFRLVSEASSYVYFWRDFGIHQVPSVTVAGVFGHEIGNLALYSSVLIALLLLGAAFNAIILRDDVKGLGRLLGLLAPFAVIAVALGSIVRAAEHPNVVVVIGASALPAFLLMDASRERDRMIAVFALSLLPLFAWACAVWNYGLLPPFSVLAATILWRFLIDPGELDQPDTEQRTRRIAAFVAIALLGLGMLVLSHAGQAGVLPGAQLSDITDRVAVALIAPIWLVHYAVQDLRRAAGIA
jgi:hypothetical protein